MHPTHLPEALAAAMVTAAFTCYQMQLNLSKQLVAIVLIAGGQDYRRALSQRRSKVVLKECFSFRILVPHSCMREGIVPLNGH